MARNSALYLSPVSTANAPNYAVDTGVGAEVGVHANVGAGLVPTRVATILVAAGGVLFLLKVTGFRFNVGVVS
jgi:hypothetical protein